MKLFVWVQHLWLISPSLSPVFIPTTPLVCCNYADISRESSILVTCHNKIPSTWLTMDPWIQSSGASELLLIVVCVKIQACVCCITYGKKTSSRTHVVLSSHDHHLFANVKYNTECQSAVVAMNTPNNRSTTLPRNLQLVMLYLQHNF
jgi:hypothetical protein